MKWHVRGTATAVGLSALLLTGCSHSAGEAPSTPTAAASSPSAGSRAERAEIAERVRSSVEDRVSADEQRFGSGVNSPCSTSSPRMFTAQCKAAAEATAGAAGLALAEVKGRAGFATLRSAASGIQAAVRSYERLGCATGPTAAGTRHACRHPAAVVAQGFDDLRDGADLALAGR